MSETLARLPDAVRADLREPLGPLYTDAEALLSDVEGPVLAVGDVVTAHLCRAGRRPDVAVLDSRTRRGDLDPDVAAALEDLDADVRVENPAATLTEDLVAALADAVDALPDRTVVSVDGEEDLAALPLLLLAPREATLVYGQPGEGMVRVDVTDEAKRTCRDLLERFDVDDRLWAYLG